MGLRTLGAVDLYIVGRWLIGFAVGLEQKALSRQHLEPTLLHFACNTIPVVLNSTLVGAILGYFGVQTTRFAALLAGAGLAIGSAWGVMLAIFAAGVFLVVLRPFKVGDFIRAGGADAHVAIARMRQAVLAIPNVKQDPAPDVVILTFTPAGPVLAACPYCHNDHYWQVYFDTNMAIREVLGDAVFPAPMPSYAIRNI